MMKDIAVILLLVHSVTLGPVSASITCEVGEVGKKYQIIAGCSSCSKATVNGKLQALGCYFSSCETLDSFGTKVTCCYTDCCTSTGNDCRDSLGGGVSGSRNVTTTRDPSVPINCESCFDESFCQTKSNCRACQIENHRGTISRSCRVTADTCPKGDVRSKCCFTDNCNAPNTGIEIPPGGIQCKVCYGDTDCYTSKSECAACAIIRTKLNGYTEVSRSCESSSCEVQNDVDMTTKECCFTDNCNAPGGGNKNLTKPPAGGVSCYDCVGSSIGSIVVADSCLVVGSNTPVSTGCGTCLKTETILGQIKSVTRTCGYNTVCNTQHNQQLGSGISTKEACCTGHLCNGSKRWHPSPILSTGMLALALAKLIIWGQ